MSKFNWDVILYNIREAREQLQAIESQVNDGNPPLKGEFQVMIEHAYHHLNFAWNVKEVSTKKYANLSDDDFNKWSKFPKEIKASKIRSRSKKK